MTPRLDDASPSHRSVFETHALLFVGVMLVGKALVLLLLGRPISCEACGLWESVGDPMTNSRAFADPYSLLHIGFGALITLWLRLIRPDWPLRQVVLTIVFSSVIWEVFENLPLMIEAFGYSPGDPLRYRGDSVLNSLGDTAFAVIGGAAGFSLPAPALLASVAVIEVGLSITIGDGYVIGLVRALGWEV